MTSSGSYSFAPSNGEIVLSAFERVRVRAPSLRQEHMRTARYEMNYLLASWANKQVNLWKVEQVSISIVANQQVYSVDPKTVMILDAWINTDQGQTQNGRYITPISRTEWASFSNKMTPGMPTVFWFDRLIAPTVTLWPIPAASNGPLTLNWFACVQMQDTNLPGGETPDIPYLWLDAIVAALAHRLARIYAPDLEQLRKADAEEAWSIAATQNTENVPTYFAPNLGAYYL